MAEAKTSSDTPLPGTVFTPRQVRILKWVVIVMGIMLVGGFALIMLAIVYQASQLSERSPAPTATSSATSSSAVVRAISVPPGMAISHISLDDNRLAVHLSGPEGSEIQIIDLGTGALIHRIPVATE